MLTEQRFLATVIIGLLMGGTLAAVPWMIRRQRLGQTILDRKQLLVRLLGLFTLFLVWIMAAMMLLILDPLTQVPVFMACFYASLLLAVALVLLVILDLRLLAVNQLRAEARLLENMIRRWTPTMEEGPAAVPSADES